MTSESFSGICAISNIYILSSLPRVWHLKPPVIHCYLSYMLAPSWVQCFFQNHLLFIFIPSLSRVVSFSQPVRFKEVYIGRCADLPANAMQGMEADMKVGYSILW